jgi:uncharacterized protein YjiS (DUF1127 family)
MTAISPATGFRRTRHSAGARLLATFNTWRQRARERAELAGLSDRALCDIGLSRADAEFIANKPFWKE